MLTSSSYYVTVLCEKISVTKSEEPPPTTDSHVILTPSPMLRLNGRGLLLHVSRQLKKLINKLKKELQSCGKCFFETLVSVMSKYFDAIKLMTHLLLKIIARD